MTDTPYWASQEFEIDRELERLAELIVSKRATPRDIALYQELDAQRARLMQPFPQQSAWARKKDAYAA